MTTIAQLITDAYQVNNLIALTVAPSGAEQEKGLRIFNRVFTSILGSDMGESLAPATLTGDVLSYSTTDKIKLPEPVRPNTRLVCTLSSATTVLLPESPQDGARFSVSDYGKTFSVNNLTLAGNGSFIEDVTQLVLDVDGVSSEWFFRQDTNNWFKVVPFLLTDTFPLPTEFEELFIYLMALRMASSEGVPVNPSVEYVIKTARNQIRSRYRQSLEMPVEPGLLHLRRLYHA